MVPDIGTMIAGYVMFRMGEVVGDGQRSLPARVFAGLVIGFTAVSWLHLVTVGGK